jgi:hypothetical protein
MPLLFVAIYKEATIPHWALHTENNSHYCIYQALGSSPRLRYDEREGVIPELDKRLSKLVLVGTIKPERFDAVKAAIAAQVVRNNNSRWNCQYWVHETIDNLIERQLIKVNQAGIAYIDARLGRFTDELPDEDKTDR